MRGSWSPRAASLVGGRELALRPTELAKRAEERGIPLAVFAPDEGDRESLFALYERRAALVRSDHHVVWRGDELPAEIEHLLDIVTGHASWGHL